MPPSLRPRIFLLLSILALLLLLAIVFLSQQRNPPSTPTSRASVNRAVYVLGENYLIVEALDDDLIHFEYASQSPLPDVAQPIAVSPMVTKTDYPGPSVFTNDRSGNLETADLQITVSPETLCVAIADKTRQPALPLTQICPDTGSDQAVKVLTLTAESMQTIYGLGEQFVAVDADSLSWYGQQRKPGKLQGNSPEGFAAGYVGNAQFPVYYALNEAGDNYALFADSPYAQTWDFRRDPWKLRASGNPLRWYIFSGPDLPDLRQDYMELTGRPPVPPKKFFGLWVSEYGYDDWGELEDKLAALRASQFPVDGFVLDLQWFGGITPGSQSHMGNLVWDTVAFPDPAGKIAELAAQGIGLMTIEESYIASNLPEYADLQTAEYLVKAGGATGSPTHFSDAWWGSGGMLDWTNPQAGDYWHDLKRQPLVEMGILGHWTDLGEPENFNLNSYYFGFPDLDLHKQADLHNLYNLDWSASIVRGYERNGVAQRPFILSRSGVSGSQRYNVAMWSGDIASNAESLAAHFQAQAHMSLSGMDYFGSDIGGFHRGGIGGDLDELYTQWFAVAALTDVPVRPHTENLCNCKETAPDRVGDTASNLANLRLRYALTPYLYSLAHRAYLYGEPTVPPLVYYYQFDANTRLISDETLLGRDLLLATIAELGAQKRDVYLPAGTWVNVYSGEWFDSPQGMWLRDVSAVEDGFFRLPLFARAGALIPLAPVDDLTLNATGLRADGSTRDELILRVYASPEFTSFTLYEDDGVTTAYQQGEVRTTMLSQQQTVNSGSVNVTIAAASGSYTGAPAERNNVIGLTIPAGGVQSVTLNSAALPQLASQEEFDAAEQGWFQASDGQILAKSGSLPVSVEKVFDFVISE